eukprot:464505-Pyramimonas_sp.AAC.1
MKTDGAWRACPAWPEQPTANDKRRKGRADCLLFGAAPHHEAAPGAKCAAGEVWPVRARLVRRNHK